LTRLRAALLRARHRDQVGCGHSGEKAMLFDHEEFALMHILNRHVPAMSEEFSIVTKYGEIEVRGEDARRIQALVEKVTRAKLRKLLAKRRQDER
jgi:hypothetical protein